MRKLLRIGYAAIPLAIASHFFLRSAVSWEPICTFILSSLGVVPLAHLMGNVTEHLARRLGPTWGGLINASFGNAAELIIAIVAINKGLLEMVKASLTGSIVGNLLLVGGGAMVVGGWGRDTQTFNRANAESSSGLLLLAVAALLFPALFHYSFQSSDPALKLHEHELSVATSVILLIAYGLGLLFTLKTHAHIFSPAPANDSDLHLARNGEATASVRRSILLLFVSCVGVAILAELLVGSAESIAAELGWNHMFVGIILLAIVGNAAEHSTALVLAKRNDLDTAMTITYQSSLQIALFVTPFLVLLSTALSAFGVGNAAPLNLLFTPMEVLTVLLAVLISTTLGLDGETNWFEGALLLSLYAIVAVAFFLVPH